MQRQAASFQNGQMLVLAGPGSGKTHVITKRIQYLIEQCKVSPDSILVITFTRAAATEMKLRSVQNCIKSSQTIFGTFHSIFYQILKKSARYRDFSLMTDRQKNQIVNRIWHTIKLSHSNQVDFGLFGNFVRDFTEFISVQKNKGINLASFQQSVCSEQENIFLLAWDLYQSECAKLKIMDYDDLLLLCRDTLIKEKNLLHQMQNRFQYLLIDEFQDINPIQFQCLTMLGAGMNNIFAVGDDDQSIYRFRASDVKIMRQFLTYYPDAQTVSLSLNYRSKKEIVSLCSSFIGLNTNRFEKNQIAASKEKGEVILQPYGKEQEEWKWIIGEIKKAKESNQSLAILTRTNQTTENYLKFLQKNQVIMDGSQMYCPIYEKESILDMIAILRFLYQGNRRSDFIRFMNFPERNLLRTNLSDPVDLDKMILQLEKQIMQETCNSKEILRQQIEELKKLKSKLDFLLRLDPFGSIQYLLYVWGFEKAIKKENQDVDQITERLKMDAKGFQSVIDYLVYLDQKSNATKDMAEHMHNQMHKQIKEDENVKVMTYHASKGLEFDVVLLPDVNDGCVPHGRFLDLEEYEEERRVFYVAMTRAKQKLVVYYKEKGKQSDSALSSFLVDLMRLKKEG